MAEKTSGDWSRGKLLTVEQRRQAAVLFEFERIKERLEADIRELLSRIEKQRRIDGNASPGLLIQKARLQDLLDSVTDEIQKASIRLGKLVEGGQRTAIDIAREQAARAPELRSALNFFDAAATSELIGIAGDGAPLAVHFAKLAKPVRQAMFEALFYGIAVGKSNPVIAREVQDALDTSRARAMTIVRTETNRAYREATRNFYADVPAVRGWRWIAALDLTTCPICWALHGRVFKTKTKFGTHPNCRCTMVPVFEGETAKFETGPEAFDKLTEAQKRAILGPGRLELYKQGAELRDFVETQKSVFGIGRRVKPIERTTFKIRPRPGSGPPPAPATPAAPAVLKFTDQKSADEWTGKISVDWQKTLNKNEAYALQHYGSTAYDDTNKKLRGLKPDYDYYDDAALDEIIRDLDSAIARFKLPAAVRVYRGFGLPGRKLKVGDVFREPGFASTSLNPSVAGKFALWARDDETEGYILQFDLPAGANVAPTQMFTHLGESELIIPRDSEFIITELRRRADGLIHAKATYRRNLGTDAGGTGTDR